MFSKLANFFQHKNVLLLAGVSSETQTCQTSIWSSLVYPITLPGHWGTTDDFTTIPFRLALSSAAPVELAKSIPVRSFILSSNLFFCLPFLLFLCTVPCRIVFAKPKDLEMFLFLDQGQEFIIFLQWLLVSFCKHPHYDMVLV